MSLAMKIIKGFENYWGDYDTYTRQLGPVLTLKETSRILKSIYVVVTKKYVLRCCILICMMMG